MNKIDTFDQDGRIYFRKTFDSRKILNYKNSFEDEKNIYSIKHKLVPKFIKAQECSFILDYIPGCSLTDFVDKQKQNIIPELNLGQKLAIAYLICEQLAAIHEKKYIHRNISPSNILIDPYFLPHIFDFTDCTFLENKSSVASSSDHGKGEYRSIEVINGNDYSEASDIYALSYTLHFLFTSKEPYADIRLNGDLFQQKCQIERLKELVDEGSDISEFIEDEDALNDKTLYNQLLDYYNKEQNKAEFIKALNDALDRVEQKIEEDNMDKYGVPDNNLYTAEHPLADLLIEGASIDHNERPSMKTFLATIKEKADELKPEDLRKSFYDLINTEVPDYYGTPKLLQAAIDKKLL